MSDHKVEPRRNGRSATCAVCGYAVVYYRTKRRWAHMSWAQAYIGERAHNRAAARLS